MKRISTLSATLFLATSVMLCLWVIGNTGLASAAESYQYVAKWGTQGTGNGQFEAPTGVALDASGNVYVADSSNNRIQKFNSNGSFITKWGSEGAGDGQFRYPWGVAVDTSDNVYVTDYDNHRIQKFRSDGTFITKWGSDGEGDGQFKNPTGISIDTSGNIYIGDDGQHRIQKFNSSGTFITKWGSIGAGNGQFDKPLGVGVDTSGNVYVVEYDNHRVQKFSSSGDFITKWGSYGAGDGQFYNPALVALDTSGNLFVSDRGNNRIQKFDAGGAFITKWGSYGSGDGQFYRVNGVAADASGYVYVADTNNHRIQKFSLATGPTAATGSATNVTSTAATLNGTVNANGLTTTAWFNYGTASGSYTGTSTTQSVSGPNDTPVGADINGLVASTTYYYRIAARNSAGNAYGGEISFTTLAPSDSAAPTGSVSVNGGYSYTNTTTVTLNLSATDAVGITAYYLSDSSTTPSSSAAGWTSVTSTTGYTANVSYTVSGGDGNKTVYVWYKDAAGNVSNAAYSSITLDTTFPSVTITNPSSTGVYTSTAGSLDLSGSASDSASGISIVTWNNAATGGNGTATGTTSWSVSGIGLSTGENTIHVTARDGANNTGTGTIKVTYSGNAPTVTTNAAASVTSTTATLNGTVNANGLSTSAWFQYGLISGTYTGTTTTHSVNGSGNTTVSIAVSGLSSGKTYYYRIAASSSAGTSYGSELSFSTPDSDVPTGSVSMNSGAAYTNEDEVTLNLSATDDIMVSGYYISMNSTRPLPSAPGWVAVSATTTYTGNVFYKLSDGDGSKTVYVWYKDSGGNVSGVASASIILDKTAPVVAITSPTWETTYTTTSNTITLSGIAVDATSGIKEVTWDNDKGGAGVASGTNPWNISSITLLSRENKITVTAKDHAGNTTIDTITVKYVMPTPTQAVTPSPAPQASPTPISQPSPSATPIPSPSAMSTPTPAPATTPTPVIMPTVVETPLPSPTLAKTPTPRPTSPPKDTEVPLGSIGIQGGSSYTNLSGITLDLQATDNVGVTGYYLADDLPMPTALSPGWTPISPTTYYHDTVSYTLTGGDGDKTVYVWYKDAGGNVSNTVSASVILDTKEPRVTITYPTAREKYKSAARTISLRGVSSDGTSGIKTVTWSNNKGGSGTASGKGDWTISDIALTANEENRITVTATDNAGNSGSDDIKVEYTVGTPVPQTTPSPAPTVTLTPFPTPAETVKPTPTLMETPKPSPSPQATPTVTLPPTPIPSPSPLKGGTIYGMVTDEDYNPLEGVVVTIKGNGVSNESNTDGDGYYRLDGLSAGKYKLKYEKEEYSTQKQEVSLEDEEIKVLETVVMEPLQNGKGAISVYVVDTSGDTLESAELRLMGKKQNSYNGTTDEAGFFEFQDLDADRYFLIVQKKGYKRARERIKLKKRESMEIEITMRSTRR